MRPLRVPDPVALRATLGRELRHSAHARFINRMHCLLLVASGCTCYQAAEVFGASPRALERWIHRYAEGGVAGLRDHPRSGRGSRKLTFAQLRTLERDIGEEPRHIGYEKRTWSGKLLQRHIQARFGVAYSERQCQRLLREWRDSPRGPDAIERMSGRWRANVTGPGCVTKV